MQSKGMTITLAPNIVEILQAMAEYNETSIATELRRAIEGRKFFTEKVAEGQNILVEDSKQNSQLKVTLSSTK